MKHESIANIIGNHINYKKFFVPVLVSSCFRVSCKIKNYDRRHLLSDWVTYFFSGDENRIRSSIFPHMSGARHKLEKVGFDDQITERIMS